MTKLEEIRQRYLKASPGPYYWGEDRDLYSQAKHDSFMGDLIVTDSGCYPPYEADKEFFQHSWEDMGWLIQELDRLYEIFVGAWER